MPKPELDFDEDEDLLLLVELPELLSEDEKLLEVPELPLEVPGLYKDDPAFKAARALCASQSLS